MGNCVEHEHKLDQKEVQQQRSHDQLWPEMAAKAFQLGWADWAGWGKSVILYHKRVLSEGRMDKSVILSHNRALQGNLKIS